MDMLLNELWLFFLAEKIRSTLGPFQQALLLISDR